MHTDEARTVPIAKLDEDVLSNIFMTSANIYHGVEFRGALYNWEDRALVVIWSCSHVCRRWRGLILGSPSLWGSLIDLDVLSIIKHEWKDEILSRTGLCRLYVRGSVEMENPGEQDSFHTLLDKHWARIDTLEVETSLERAMENHTWQLLFRPTTSLRKFHFRTRDYHPHSKSLVSSFETLLSAGVPCLQEFALTNATLTLSQNSRWVSDLRKLEISLSESISVADLLQILEQMPRIEYLSLNFAYARSVDMRTPVMLRPRNLTEIFLYSDVQSSVTLLSYIVPPVGCSLSLSFGNALDKSELPLAKEVITRYLLNFLQYFTSQTVVLLVAVPAFVLTNYPGSPQRFEVSVSYMQEKQLAILIPFFDAFASCDFSSSSFGPLFSEKAPMIHCLRFRSRRMNLILPPDIPWVSRIRCLEICSMPSMSIEHWLSVLKQTPLLEFLELDNTLLMRGREDRSASTLLYLPNLSQIVLKGSLLACTAFLGGIEPQDGCGLRLICSCEEVDNSTDPSLNYAVLPRYLQNFFNHNIVTRLCFWSRDTRFFVENEDYAKFSLPIPKKGFSIDIRDIPTHQYSKLFRLVLGALSCCDLSHIPTLDFLSDISFPRPSGLQDLDSTVCDFLLLLHGVETITTYPYRGDVHFLYRSMLMPYCNRGDCLVLPKLSVLIQVERRGWDARDTIYSPSRPCPELFSFLSLRVHSQVPIEVLDLRVGDLGVGVDVFACFRGLKVIYRVTPDRFV